MSAGNLFPEAGFEVIEFKEKKTVWSSASATQVLRSSSWVSGALDRKFLPMNFAMPFRCLCSQSEPRSHSWQVSSRRPLHGCKMLALNGCFGSYLNRAGSGAGTHT
jgi:hypothetical protein